MKALSIARLAAASILSVGLAQGGCAAPGDEGGEAVEVVEDVTDEMWDGRVADAELCVFPYAENVITVEHPQAVGLPWDGALEEGKFYKVVADVTYLNGGVAGYVDYPQVNSVASCEEVAPDELDLPTLEETRYGLVRIGDYAEGELLFHELGIAAVWAALPGGAGARAGRARADGVPARRHVARPARRLGDGGPGRVRGRRAARVHTGVRAHVMHRSQSAISVHDL